MGSRPSHSTGAGKARSVKSPRKSPQRRKPAQKSRRKQILDPAPVLDAFQEALAIISTAHKVIGLGTSYGPEETVLRLGVAALEAACNQLEKFDLQLWHAIKKPGCGHGEKP